jgi:hypothetical protein
VGKEEIGRAVKNIGRCVSIHAGRTDCGQRLADAGADADWRQVKHEAPRYYCCYGFESSLALFIFLHNTPVKNTTRPAQACRSQAPETQKTAPKSPKKGAVALF